MRHACGDEKYKMLCERWVTTNPFGNALEARPQWLYNV